MTEGGGGEVPKLKNNWFMFNLDKQIVCGFEN